jgi:hypothetical protein
VGGPARAFALLAELSTLVAAATAVAAPPPVLRLAVSCGAAARASDGGPVRVGNLGLIGLEIGMHYFDLPPVQTSPGPLDLILAGDEGRPSSQPPNLELTATSVAGSARAPVVVRLHSSGVSGGSEYHGKLPGARFVHAISVWLTIPLDPSAQRASVEQFLDELRRAGKAEEARRFESMLQGNRMLREQLAREQRPGAYELVARYRPRPGDHWPGELRSAPLRLDIVAKGRWFDALLTGRAPTGPVCEP